MENGFARHGVVTDEVLKQLVVVLFLSEVVALRRIGELREEGLVADNIVTVVNRVVFVAPIDIGLSRCLGVTEFLYLGIEVVSGVCTDASPTVIFLLVDSGGVIDLLAAHGLRGNRIAVQINRTGEGLAVLSVDRTDSGVLVVGVVVVHIHADQLSVHRQHTRLVVRDDH